MIDLARALHDKAGNVPSLPGIYPDMSAPVVHNSEGGRTLSRARWGLPSPKHFVEGRNSDPGVTNIRNTSSPHWRRWLGVANRALVPFTSFAEFDTLPNGKKEQVWFDALFREMSDTVATTTEGLNAKRAIVVKEASDFSDDFIQEAALNLLRRDVPAVLASLNGGLAS